ncbi:hypothetical protein L9F63_023616 [Diploptera punctata]|uniref:Uncharacterized protein n=1 Tax=Diploptera punctata TaxID=6984 RepID=A0AAD7ZIX5_DIPPU|nr:hypothetical protein L9F63_023616 [Diploptera punctata]
MSYTGARAILYMSLLVIIFPTHSYGAGVGGAGAGLALNGDKHHRNVEHRGRHHHNQQQQHGNQNLEDATQLTTTPSGELEDRREDFDNACCSRQEKYVAIGFGVSGEVVQLDVGQCQKSCRSLFTLMDPDITDSDISPFKPCAAEAACLPSKSRLQRVSTLHGMQQLAVVEECECRHKPERCYRQPHTLQLYPGTPYETHLDVGICSGRCQSEAGCRPVRNKTVSVPGPNGVHCHSVIEECTCTGGCYRMSSLEIVYDYTDLVLNDTETSPAIKEVDVGRCSGTCTGGQTRKCLFRDQADPNKCLAGLYGKQSSCTPSHFKVHRYTSKDRQAKEIIAITDCKCM